MINMRKTFQSVAVLVMLHMGTTLVLPPGMDLELCFGMDGHFDLQLDGCQAGVSQKKSTREQPSFDRTEHHDDCFHTPLVCNTAQKLLAKDNKSEIYTSERKQNLSRTSLIFSKSLTDFVDTYFSSKINSSPHEEFYPPYIISLQSIVLLI